MLIQSRLTIPGPQTSLTIMIALSCKSWSLFHHLSKTEATFRARHSRRNSDLPTYICFCNRICDIHQEALCQEWIYFTALEVYKRPDANLLESWRFRLGQNDPLVHAWLCEIKWNLWTIEFCDNLSLLFFLHWPATSPLAIIMIPVPWFVVQKWSQGSTMISLLTMSGVA